MVNSFFQLARPIFQALKDLSFTGRCILCSDIGQPGLDICAGCEESLPRLEHYCLHCSLPLSGPDQTLCGQCQLIPPPFQRTVAAYLYHYPVAELISGFKYNRQLSYGKVLCLADLDRFVSANTDNKPDIITPIPLHWRRQLKRGFNQSEHIATYLAKGMGIPMQPLLKRSQFTQPQQQLDARQRRQNLHGAFEATRDLDGQCIAVVDDVMTTGATAAEVSKVLLEAGAAEVHIWVLARTP